MIARRVAAALPVLALVTFLVWFGNAQATDRYWMTLGIEALWVATALVGLNILVGDLGLVSLGHFVFFVIGGFAGSIWAVQAWGLDPWLGFPAALVVGMALGALLALTCCHLRGFYLTVVTLAFGLVSTALALLIEGPFGGLQGRPVEQPLDTSFGFLDASNPNRPFVGLYWIGVVMLGLGLFATRNLRHSRWGRAYRAIREAELAAQASGVRTYWYKVSGFALSAGIVATAGVLAAQTNLQVTMLDGTSMVGRSFEWLIFLIVAGVGTLAGPVVGAFVFTLGFGIAIGGATITDRLGAYETLFNAALVIAVVIIAPRGLVGALRQGVGALIGRLGMQPRSVKTAPLPRERTLPRPRHRAGDEDDSTDALLVVEGVTIRFGGLAAVRAADLTVRTGSVHGLIGPNGSGKSTLVNIITGVYRPETGRVRFRGEPIDSLTVHAISRRGIARTFQNVQLCRRMTAIDNVMVGLHGRTRVDLARSLLLPASLRGEERRARERARELLAFVGLSGREHDRAGNFPYADQRRLEIARALASDPDLVVLDEPAAGMNPTEAQALITLVREIRDAGITVVLIEHRMEVVMGVSDVITVLDAGEVIAHGTPQEVQDNPLVIEAYLGERVEPDAAPAVDAGAPVPAGVATDAGGAERPADGDAVLTVRGLAVEYGAVRALRGVDLDVGQGEVVALIGSNGAGKSTSLKTISGMAELNKAVRGEIVFAGERVDRRPAHRIARMGLAHVPEGRRLFPESTVEENLALGGYGRADAALGRSLDAIYDRFPILATRRHMAAGLLSGGEQQMLAIGRGLASDPQFLLLDEPSLGLAPLVAEEVFRIVRTLADDGLSVLVVEQMATRALAIADRGYVLETGAVVAAGLATRLAQDPVIKRAYLGDAD
ncbi:MAG TPA: ATP-binding cassette domain-containing protein [Acidimicrobiia bacterium]|nr:ATP-binding cassette domain-containing protein [Acidimicrobiia bacterium]